MQKRLSLYSLFLILSVSMIVSGCGENAGDGKPKQSLSVTRHDNTTGLIDNHITALAYLGTQVCAGTPKGLLRFDGVNWQIHNTKNTNVLGSDIIEALLFAERALWICTDNGVCRFDGNSWTSIMTGSRARGIAISGNKIAVATAHGVDYSTGEPFRSLDRTQAGLPSDEVNAVFFDSQGKLWAGTNAGMGGMSGDSFQTFTGPAKQLAGTSLVDSPPVPPTCQLAGNNINLMIPFNGLIAIGTTTGLSITDMGNTWTNYKAPHKDWVQRAGKIFEEDLPGNSPLSGNNITALASTQNDRGLFVGTNKGLALLREGKWVELKELLPQFEPGFITSLATQGDELWVGTKEGLYKITGIETLFPKPPEGK